MTLKALYRRLLHLYPPGFRREFGDEMESFFAERIEDARSRGRFALGLACCKAFADLFASAIAEQWDTVPRRRRRKDNEMLNGIGADLRSALRAIAKRPALSVTAVLTLAVGLGAASIVFAVIDAVLLRRLPYVEPDRIVMIWNLYDGGESYSAPPDYIDRLEQATTLESLAAVAPTTMNLSGELEPRHVDVARVSARFFDVFGVEDARGGPIRFPDERGPEPKNLAVLAHGLWQNGYGGEPDIRGQTLELNGELHEIVGVLPEPFDFPRGTQIYVPLGFDPDELGDDNRGNEYLQNVGRLREGVSVDRARAEMETIAASVLDRVPERRDFLVRNGWGASVVPLREHLTENVRPALVVLGFAVVLVLAVSAANVANMLLSSLLARGRELAVRSSLGASRARLVRQLVVESSLLSFTGAALALLVSSTVLGFVPLVVPQDVPRIEQTQLDLWVFGFTLFMAAVTGVLCGIVPAWQASSGRLHGALRAGASGGSSKGLRRFLVVSEVALALTLLAGAGLLVRSFEVLTGLDPGFTAEGRVALRLQLPSSQYPEAGERLAFQRALLDGLRAIPNVHSAAVSDRIPLDGSGWTGTFRPVGYEPAPGESTPGGEFNVVSADYFRTLGIPLLAGREFSEADTADTARVVIVDALTAERFWPYGAVGERIQMGRSPESQREIVGVVEHVKARSLDEPERMQVYFASNQVGGSRLGVTLHVDGAMENAVTLAREEVARLDPGLPVYAVQSLDDLVASSLAFRRFQLELLGAFALFTVFLASVGLYGALAYSVSVRQVEMGVRVAMGARASAIAALVLKEATILVAFGLVAGALVSLALSRFFENLVFGVEATDPVSFTGAVVLLVTIAIVAAWLPARRASRVDPVEALRS